MKLLRNSLGWPDSKLLGIAGWSWLGDAKIISAAVTHHPWLGQDGNPLNDVSAYAQMINYVNIMYAIVTYLLPRLTLNSWGITTFSAPLLIQVQMRLSVCKPTTMRISQIDARSRKPLWHVSTTRRHGTGCLRPVVECRHASKQTFAWTSSIWLRL